MAWHEQIAEEFRTNPEVVKYNSLDDFIKGSLEAKSRLGRSLSIPGEDAGETQRKEFIEKLQRQVPEVILKPTEENEADFWKLAGVPDTPDEYEPPEVKTVSTDEITELKKVAKEIGLTKSQYKRLVALTDAQKADAQSEADTRNQEDAQKLKEKWGMATDHNKATVQALITKFQDPDMPMPTELNAPALLFLGNLAKAFKQDPQAFTQPAGGDQLTPAEAAEKATEIRNRLINDGRGMTADERMRLLKKVAHYQRMQQG